MSSAENDRDVEVRALSTIDLYKFEDENWSTVHLRAGYSTNDRVHAQPYIVFPIEKGEFDVYIECEGFQAVKSIGGKADGSWEGLIAYSTSDSGWLVSEYVGVSITKYQSSTAFVGGHPDTRLNDCSFKQDRAVECDIVCSFRLSADSDNAKWLLYAPWIQKASEYNYIVSYGAYTEKTCELGSISVNIDEVNEQQGPSPASKRWGRRRLDRERQLVKTLVNQPSSDLEEAKETGSLRAPGWRERVEKEKKKEERPSRFSWR